MKRETLMLTVLLISLLISSVLLIWHMKPQPTIKPIVQAPDMYMSQVAQTKYDTRGYRQYHLQSPSWHYYRYSGNDQSYLDQPRMIYYNTTNQKPWFIKAKMAVANKQQQIKLQQQVRLRQQADDPQDKVTIHTDTADVYPGCHYAITYDPVAIYKAHHEMHATGAKVNFQNHQIDLLSNARGHYELQ
jgi:LPS export ABC transporter protein LptC